MITIILKKFLHHFLFCILKAFCYIVERLMLSYGILGNPSLLRVETSQFWFARQTPLQLAKRGKKSCAISFKFSILSSYPKLYCEPVAGCKFLNKIIRSSQTRQTNFLTELGKCRVSKQWNMSQQFMANVLNILRFR